MSDWISVDDRLPSTPHEDNNYESKYCGEMISNSIEISDGYNLARGHYVEIGNWVIYDAEHDFQIVDPNNITHWMPLPDPPETEAPEIFEGTREQLNNLGIRK